MTHPHSNEQPDLLTRIQAHIRQMAPHHREREAGKLLIEATGVLAIHESGTMSERVFEYAQKMRADDTKTIADLRARLGAADARLDHIEALRVKSISRGFAWDSFHYTAGESPLTIREQIDAALTKKGSTT